MLIYFEHSAAGPGTKLISHILFHGDSASYEMILSRLLSTGLAYLSGTPGGIFSPSLTIGATIGSKLGTLFHSNNVHLLTILGMIGFLTGLTHAPFTSFILVVEMTDRHSAIFPMMVTALVAYGIAKSVEGKSFYEFIRDHYLADDQLRHP